jgi:tRNA pseudouridine55 synthase
MATRPELPELDGIVNLDKPLGWSSAKAVAVVQAVIGGKGRKVGHAGTLDPRAGGVLVLLVGRATHLAELLMDAGKEYVAAVRLGATSSTDDSEGRIAAAPAPAAGPPPRDQVQGVLRQFVGPIRQQPPAHSAVKIAGKRAYKLARRGRHVETPVRTVVVHAIDLVDYNWPVLRLRIECGRGTYIRSLARDIGAALNVGGYLLQLRRTRVGAFRAEDAVQPADCRGANLPDWLLPLERAADHLPPARRIALDDRQVELLGRGIVLDARRVDAAGPLLTCNQEDNLRAIEPLALFDQAGRLLAIARLVGPALAPVHVFRPLFGPLPRSAGDLPSREDLTPDA